jgi:hypothetical protein
MKNSFGGGLRRSSTFSDLRTLQKKQDLDSSDEQMEPELQFHMEADE